MQVEIKTILELTEEEQNKLSELLKRLSNKYFDDQMESIEELINATIDPFLFDHIVANIEMLLEGEES